MLPPDGHVHTEWSWDAAAGSMERSCARAVALGLPSIAFTEHADFTGWLIAPGVKARMRPKKVAQIGPGNSFRPHSFLSSEQRRFCRCRSLEQLRPVVPDVANGFPDRPDAQDVFCHGPQQQAGIALGLALGVRR